jgi:hypothetical protein
MISITTAPQGLLPFVNLFGKLYYGTLNSNVFLNMFQAKKNQTIQSLLSEKSVDRARDDSGRLLNFLQNHWQVEHWNYPAVATNTVSGIQWPAGNKRFLTTGITKPDPWTHFKVLLLDNYQLDVNSYFDNYVEISSDLELEQILKKNLELIDLQIELIEDHGHSKLLLKYIGDQYAPPTFDSTGLDNFQNWQKKYPRPRLQIYTEWPELITDQHNVWNWSVVGDLSTVKNRLFNPGHLENYARQQHEETNIKTQSDHILWVRNPRRIDLGDFVFWINNTHSAFCDTQGEFVLYRPDQFFLSKNISLSHY